MTPSAILPFPSARLIQCGAAFLFVGTLTHFATAQETRRSVRHPDWSVFSKPQPENAKPPVARPVLPPLPEGVEELAFRDFFKIPAGPRGLELTERLKSLDGKHVRVLGFMVHEDLARCNADACAVTSKGGHPIPAWLQATVTGRMLFTPEPESISQAHYGLCDDLPPQTLFVTVPTLFGQLVPYTPGPMLLTGVLSVGNKTEVDGRVSVVRLVLDPPPPARETSRISSTANPPIQKKHP